MNIALIGAPFSGRSTLFRAMAGSPGQDTGKPLTVRVPDPRLDFLAGHWKPKRVVNATVTFTDVPSPVFSAGSMAMIRDASAVLLVLDNHTVGDMEESLANAGAELILADMAVLEKRLERLRKESRSGGPEGVAVEKALGFLEDGMPLRRAPLSLQEKERLSPFAPASLKPLMVVGNRAGDGVEKEEAARAGAEAAGAVYLSIDAGFELELWEIPREERPAYLRVMGCDEPGLDRVVQASYSMMNLVSFLTMGREEVRAWPIPAGSTALKAAGMIHSDFARGFIRAQVIPFSVFHRTPDPVLLKQKGLVGIEGKDYPVKDGDIIEIRFSVQTRPSG